MKIPDFKKINPFNEKMTSDIERDFQIQMQISLYNLLDVNYYAPYRTIFKILSK